MRRRLPSRNGPAADELPQHPLAQVLQIAEVAEMHAPAFVRSIVACENLRVRERVEKLSKELRQLCTDTLGATVLGVFFDVHDVPRRRAANDFMFEERP
jgi:hypothetical protein